MWSHCVPSASLQRWLFSAQTTYPCKSLLTPLQWHYFHGCAGDKAKDKKRKKEKKEKKEGKENKEKKKDKGDEDTAKAKKGGDVTALHSLADCLYDETIMATFIQLRPTVLPSHILDGPFSTVRRRLQRQAAALAEIDRIHLDALT